MMSRIAQHPILALALIVLLAPPAHAQAPKIAQIKTASGQVTIVRDGSNLPARVGDLLYERDILETGSDGSIGVTFTDNTAMSAGTNSEVALAEYRFDSSNFNGSMLTDMRK